MSGYEEQRDFDQASGADEEERELRTEPPGVATAEAWRGGDTIEAAIACCDAWEPNALIIGNVRAVTLGNLLRELARLRAALASHEELHHRAHDEVIRLSAELVRLRAELDTEKRHTAALEHNETEWIERVDREREANAQLRADSMRGAVEALMRRVREMNTEAAAIHRRGDHTAGIAREAQADALEREVRWLEQQAASQGQPGGR